MPVTPTYPGLYIEELPSSSHTITPAPTSITAFVGYTHPFRGLCATEGRWGQAIQIFNFVDYERMFGGLYQPTAELDANVADAVYQFFLNGGTNAYVVALRPRWVTQVGAGGTPARASFDPASTTLNGITFTAKELTSDTNPISITIRDVNLDTADILLTFETTLELHRGVKVAAGPSTDKDLIQTRLASSSLVTVTVAAGAAFTEATATIGDLTPPANAHGTFLAKDFTDAFVTDGELDKVDIFNLLVVPGVNDNAVMSAALAFCSANRAFFIMDPAGNWSADDTTPGLTKVEDAIGTVPNTYPNGALYFPYLKTQDPLTSAIVEQPPSGFVAGIYARTDTNRGVWKAPAGLETSILNTTGVVDSGRMTDMRQGTVNDKGVNVLRSFPGSGTVVWGARTVGSNPALRQWRYVPVRRTALFIENTLMRNLGWVVFEPNDEPLWTAIRVSVEGFMLSLFRQSAFEGRTPSQAFRVLCDNTTTTDQDVAGGIVNVVVAFRPLKPAEFVIIKISQLAG